MAGGLSKVAQRQCTHFITFRLTNVAEVKRILEEFKARKAGAAPEGAKAGLGSGY